MQSYCSWKLLCWTIIAPEAYRLVSYHTASCALEDRFVSFSLRWILHRPASKFKLIYLFLKLFSKSFIWIQDEQVLLNVTGIVGWSHGNLIGHNYVNPRLHGTKTRAWRSKISWELDIDICRSLDKFWIHTTCLCLNPSRAKQNLSKTD